MIGQHIGNYHIIGLLGEGGMACVYKAYDERLDRFVAIKVITSSRATQDASTFIKRFEREAKTLALLTHPNIVGVIDYGQFNEVPYLVMEYLPGGTLKKWMGKPVSYWQAARMLIPIAQALDFAHQHKIIHRDIKPANILLTESGAPMLSDFGIVKLLENDPQAGLTGAGVGIGTPEYMSPEQGQGLAVDGRADIYSLGLVFYEMVTGHKPFQADTPMGVVIKQVSQPPPDPRSFVSDLPQEVEAILLRALEKKAENRYQTMAEFSAALESISQTGRSSTGVQPIHPVNLKKKKFPWLLAAGVLLITLCSISLLAAGGWWFLSHNSPGKTATASKVLQPAPIDDTNAALDKDIQERPALLYTLAQEQSDTEDNRVYLVNLDHSQPLLWNWGWCAIDRQTLDDNLKHIQFAFFINDIEIPQEQLAGRYSSRAQYECFYLYTLLDNWPPGAQRLVVRMKIDAPLSDGYKEFPPKIETNTFNVFVAQ